VDCRLGFGCVDVCKVVLLSELKGANKFEESLGEIGGV
jgi:hypothetical protein